MDRITPEQLRVVAAISAGCSVAGTSKHYRVSRDTVYSLLRSPVVKDAVAAMGEEQLIKLYAEPDAVMAIKQRTMHRSIIVPRPEPERRPLPELDPRVLVKKP